ncbi:MAG: hypothetical protein SVM80_04540 [Halobacteriota archaeon]|nr:hypothetical protein [Halobacteriota archaeon]
MSKKLLNESGIRDKILVYLIDGLDKGKRYFKSKYIAQDLGLSPKEVGTNLGILSEECESLKIEKWGYSKSTTWKVELRSTV